MSYRIVIVAEYEQNGTHWIESELKKLKKTYLFIDDKTYNIEDYQKSYGRLIYWRKYIKLANRTLNETSSDDVIVSLTFTVGLIISLLAKLRGQKRKVLSLNLIAYDNSKMDFIKKPLFRYLFLKNNLISTVNSEEYIEKFNQKFSLNNQKVLYLLNDPINPRMIKNISELPSDYRKHENLSCFSGGEANRDWECLIACAECLEDVKFNVIARKFTWDLNLAIPKNMDVEFDKSSEYFINKLLESDIVIIPLKDDMVAGLTVFIQAIAMKKFVLISDIPATRKYVPNDCKNILVALGDTESFIEKITYFRINKEERSIIIEKLYEYLLNNFSTECYVNRIIEIIEDSLIKGERV